MTTNPTVAIAIIDQLGGRMFLRMTGAKDMIAYPNGIKLRIPARMAKNGINGMSIMLNGSDLYDVQFLKVNMTKQTHVIVSEHHDMFNDQLRELFERETGLYTSL